MGQFTIDTLNKTDRDNAMVALHAIVINNNEDPLFCPINVYKEKVSKLEALISDYQKCQAEINSLKEKLINENEENNNLIEVNKNLQIKNESVEKSNKELTAEINVLKEKLSRFIPGYGTESKLTYFKPEGNRLETTYFYNAFFVGASVDENVYEFSFNEEKGIHIKAIQAKDEVLIPFCDIEYDAQDGNYVENVHKGTFSLINGEFKIIEKAKIKIVVKK